MSISSASAMNTDISHITYRLIFKKIDDENRSYRRKCMLNGKTIGYIRYNPAPTGAYIQKLFVENEYRNLGIGSTLFIMTLTHIKKLGSPVAQWHTKAAKNFYLPFGARTIKENNNGLDQM